jgi:hypothetical protein
MDEISHGPEPRVHGRRARRLGAAAAAGVGITLGAAGIAAAAADPTPTPTAGTSSQVAPPPGAPGGGHRHGGHGPRGERGIGPGGALHGEFVVPDGNGGYRTVQTQRGVVTAVSSTSLSVKSEDGFTKTYVLTPSTMVNAGRDGIATVAKDEEVAVVANVAGGTSTAIDVRDLTKLKAQRELYGPRHAPKGPDPAPSGTPASPSSYNGSSADVQAA